MLVIIVFVVAAPHHSPVLVVGMPELRAIKATALRAVNGAGEHPNSTVTICTRLTKRKLTLHHVEYFRSNDGLMVPFDVVLLDFAVVAALLLGQEIHCIGFLQQRVTLVLFVA